MLLPLWGVKCIYTLYEGIAHCARKDYGILELIPVLRQAMEPCKPLFAELLAAFRAHCLSEEILSSLPLSNWYLALPPSYTTSSRMNSRSRWHIWFG
jgi:hypothetical protein